MLVELFAEYQTEPMKIQVVDGKLPENEYGNIEVFNGVPEGCLHLEQRGLWRACKKLNIQYKSAVVGFDKKSGRMVAIKSGIVILKADKPALMKEYKKLKVEIEAAEKKKLIDEQLGLWKAVFKTMLVKRYMNRHL